MTEDEIGELLTALVEDFSTEQLSDEEFMLSEFDCLLGGTREFQMQILAAVREIKRLRADLKPAWTQYLQRH